MLNGTAPGPWGPTVSGRTRFRLVRRALSVIGMVALVGSAALGTTAFMLYREFEQGRTVISLPELDVTLERSGARHFLLVGSDARDALASEDRRALALGSFEGQRSDTVIYVTISADRSQVTLVSLPRDLLVMDNGRRRKLTDVYAGGPDALIRVLRDNFGLPVNHYVEISFGGFLDAVRTLGGVRLCLDEPLVDRKAGADLAAGCHQRDAAEALAFVRSRAGMRSDFARIDRQQTFLRAVLRELTDAAVLTNPGQLFQLVDDVSGSMTTDDQLGLNQIRYLANDMRQVVADGMPMTTVPSYAQRIGQGDFVLLYRPGAEAMFNAIRAGDPLPSRGTPEARADTSIALVSAGRPAGASVIERTLYWAGFTDTRGWVAPAALSGGPRTVVYPASAAKREQAEWVAGLLGAELRSLPAPIAPPADKDVIVVTGDDAVEASTF